MLQQQPLAPTVTEAGYHAAQEVSNSDGGAGLPQARRQV